MFFQTTNYGSGGVKKTSRCDILSVKPMSLMGCPGGKVGCHGSNVVNHQFNAGLLDMVASDCVQLSLAFKARPRRIWSAPESLMVSCGNQQHVDSTLLNLRDFESLGSDSLKL